MMMIIIIIIIIILFENSNFKYGVEVYRYIK